MNISTRGGIILIIILLISILSLSFIIPLSIPKEHVVTEESFGGGLDTYHYLQNGCPCYNPDPSDFATNERTISNTYFAQSESIPDPHRLSSFVWAWGQFIDHDITLSKSSSDESFIIPFDETRNMTLKRVVAKTTNSGCREPKSLISPMIDASTVYGDYLTPERILSIREPNKCKLILDEYNLPPIINGSYYCGDERCGEHVLLTTLHTLFIREHNYWCERISQDNPTFNQETLFWKARAMVVSIIQHITYDHWLPMLFGTQSPLLKGINVPNVGDHLHITTEFSIAGYRFGHSMVGEKLGKYDLKDLFFNTNFLKTEGIENVAFAAATTPSERVDNLVVDGLRNFLFGSIGEDLVTRNLFRGRETFVGSYEQICGCYGTEPFSGSVDKRDLLLALLSEPLFPGSSLPPTIAKIVAEQFVRLRNNDPLFYTKRTAELGSQYLTTVKETSLYTLFKRHTNLSPKIHANLFIVQ